MSAAMMMCMPVLFSNLAEGAGEELIIRERECKQALIRKEALNDDNAGERGAADEA